MCVRVGGPGGKGLRDGGVECLHAAAASCAAGLGGGLLYSAGPCTTAHPSTNRCLPPARPRADWFLCLFCTSLPSETAARVWDALLHEGTKVLFRVALALLKLHEGALLAQDNPGELLRAARRVAAEAFDRDALMQARRAGADRLAGLPAVSCVTPGVAPAWRLPGAAWALRGLACAAPHLCRRPPPAPLSPCAPPTRSAMALPRVCCVCAAGCV